MILLSFDLETTGLNVEKDRPIEVGAILYSSGQNKQLESAGYLVKSDVPITKEVTDITGISQSAVNKFGYDSRVALDNLQAMIGRADAFIGQNVVRFDKRVYEYWCQREGLQPINKLWIDTRTDLVNYRTGLVVEGKHLGYMAADAGFLNLFPHAAMSDCQTVLKLLDHYAPGENLNRVIERAESETIALIAHVTFDTNSLAKERKFRWNPEYKVWYKVAKRLDVETEAQQAKFDISIETNIPIEKLMYN